MNDQRSTTEQLRDLIGIANQHGLYDAADFCRQEVERVEAKVRAREHDHSSTDPWTHDTRYLDGCWVDRSAEAQLQRLAGRLDAAVTDAAGVEE